MPGWLKKAKELWSWYNFAIGVSALAVSGVTIAIGGAVWLAKLGLPLPLVIMAGYCTFVGAVYLALTPLAYRALIKQQLNTKATKSNHQPNYTAARLLHEYELGPASRLWCDIDPNSNATYDSQAWLETFKSAIKTGKLEFIPKSSL